MTQPAYPLTTQAAYPLIYAQIAAVMADIDAIGKDRLNTGPQSYKFRGIDDIYNELHAHLAKHKVFTVPEVLEERTEERKSAKGNILIYRILKIKYTFYAEDGSNVSAIVIGEGMDSGDKAANKAMAVAHKYALMQVFSIPTEDAKDPENESHEIVAKNTVTIYSGEPQQKEWLANTLRTRGITDIDKMRQFHSKAIGKTTDVIEYLIQHEEL